MPNTKPKWEEDLDAKMCNFCLADMPHQTKDCSARNNGWIKSFIRTKFSELIEEIPDMHRQELADGVVADTDFTKLKQQLRDKYL